MRLRLPLDPRNAVAQKEDKSGWSAFLRHLKERRLKGVQPFISDACLGLRDSVADYYPEARWQRCVVHFYRNAKVKEIARMLKAIRAQESLATVESKAVDVIANLRTMKLPTAAAQLEDAIEQTLTYYRFPDNHWLRIRTNNLLERIIRAIRRRTRMVGASPDGQSALTLCAARLRHIAGTKWGTQRHLNMGLLFKQVLEPASA